MSTTLATILFTDLVGSTEAAQRAGHAAYDRYRQQHFAAMRDAIAATGGMEVKTVGDAFMAAFEGAGDAVACGVAMQQAQARLNRRGIAAGLRVGISAGDVTKEGGDYFGMPVVEASRLCAVAKGGQVLVSDVVRLLDRSGLHTFMPAGAFELKGISAPVSASEAVYEEPDAEPPAAGRTPFIGRREERSMLGHLLDEAGKGSGSFVLIAGEAGLGKTRLAEELIEGSRSRGMFTAVGRCYEMEGAPPYVPFVEIVDYSARVVPLDNLLRALGDSAPEVAKLAPRLRRLVADLGEPLDLPPEQARHYLFESYCDFVERGGRVQPTLLVVDDLHWADESTCLLLEHLVRRLGEMAVVVAATCRENELSPEARVTRTLESLARTRLVHRISLRRFGEDEVRSMLRLLGGKEPPQALVDLILSETEGVPYFIEETFRHLMEEGRLFGPDGAWQPNVEVGEVEVPENVRLVIRRRLERVSEPAIQVLTQAAAIGRNFTYEFLRELVQADEDQLLDAIDEAEQASLIQATEGSSPYFAFRHEQIRQTLLGNISFPRRQRLHLRVAEAIERVYGESLDEQVGDLAYHLSLAGQRDRAVEYLVRAGEERAARYANTEALEYFQRAIEMDERGRWRQRVLRARARLLLGLFRGREAAPELEELLADCRSEGNGAGEVDVLLDLGQAYWMEALDDPVFLQQSHDALRKAYELARDLGDKARMARALLPTTWFTSFWPEYEETLRGNITEAFALAEEVGDDDLILQARRARLFILSGDEAEQEAAAIRAGLLARRSFVRLNDLLFSMMWLYYVRGRFHACVDTCDEGIGLARRIAAEPVQYASIKGLALLDLGQFGDAWAAFQEEVADDAHPFGRTQRDLGIAAFYSEAMAHERAVELALDVRERARKLNRPWMENWAQQILSASLVSLGRVSGISGEEIRTGFESFGLRASLEAGAEALLVSGAAAEALALADRAVAGSEARGRGRDYVPALELRGRALLAVGQREEARSVLADALDLARGLDYGRMLWRVQQALGDAHEALGNAGEASRSYAAAALSVRAVAETIDDPELRAGFLANPRVAAVLGAGTRGPS